MTLSKALLTVCLLVGPHTVTTALVTGPGNFDPDIFVAASCGASAAAGLGAWALWNTYPQAAGALTGIAAILSIPWIPYITYSITEQFSPEDEFCNPYIYDSSRTKRQPTFYERLLMSLGLARDTSDIPWMPCQGEPFADWANTFKTKDAENLYKMYNRRRTTLGATTVAGIVAACALWKTKPQFAGLLAVANIIAGAEAIEAHQQLPKYKQTVSESPVN